MIPSRISICPHILSFVLQLEDFKSQSVSGGHGDAAAVRCLSGQVDAQGCGAEGRKGEEAWGPAPRLPRRSADLSCRENRK